MMFRTVLLLCLSSMIATAAWAQDRPVVVELFTSQGCSACPPADAFLAGLADTDGVIPLALHVDYWDYIGWTDRFADPVHTTRQRGYARSGGWRQVYTPQVVVNGTSVAVGSRADAVRAAMADEAGKPARVVLRLSRDADKLKITTRPTAGPVGPMDIHVVRYDAAVPVSITRGENAGRDIVYTHVVREWDVAGRWDGSGTHSTVVPLSGAQSVAVLVQAPDYGPILAAARLR